MPTLRRPKQDDALSIDQILRQLRDGPRLIGATTSGLSPANLRLRPTPDEWSINDNLAHLRAAADVWGTYVGRIVAEDNPTFTSINPRAHMRKTDYPELEFAPSFRAFSEQRDALMAMLDDLPEAGWTRTATVKVYGQPFEFTVHYYADKLARHEAVHLPQIAGTVSSLTR
jgi:DinB superfamily